MHRWLAKLGRPLFSASLHPLPPLSSNTFPVHLSFLIRRTNFSFASCNRNRPSRLQNHPLALFTAQLLLQSRHFATKKVKRSRSPITPMTSKIKKYKLKAYSSFKYRFRTLGNGQIRRWRAGKRHNAHSKSNKAKRRLRKPSIVHAAYAKVMKKLNFAG